MCFVQLCFKDTTVFSIVLDTQSMDVNETLHLAVMARYCDLTVREELCCWTAMPQTTKGEDIAVCMERFEDRGIDVVVINMKILKWCLVSKRLPSPALNSSVKLFETIFLWTKPVP